MALNDDNIDNLNDELNEEDLRDIGGTGQEEDLDMDRDETM